MLNSSKNESEIHDGSCNASVWQSSEGDILELSRLPYCGVGICHASIGLVLMMKEIDLKLTQGMAER